jgi:hypothetical protein
MEQAQQHSRGVCTPNMLSPAGFHMQLTTHSGAHSSAFHDVAAVNRVQAEASSSLYCLPCGFYLMASVQD